MVLLLTRSVTAVGGISAIADLPSFGNLRQPDAATAAGALGVYPRGMAGQTPEPPPAGQRPGSDRQTEHREHDDEPAVEHEHIGPISIERHVKADGRALILYTRDAPPAT
jgi:hypothetical protein